MSSFLRCVWGEGVGFGYGVWFFIWDVLRWDEL